MDTSMIISGILIQARPQNATALRAQLAALPGVEVHAVSADGRLVVTVEGDDERDMTAAFARVQTLDGVHATTLIYNHIETLDDEQSDTKEIQS
jgi:nitrate reductase NapD